MVQSAPGRFEIAALDATLAHGIAAATEEAWRTLTGPLSLPDSFSSPIFVRIVSDQEPGPFRVSVEAGGIVSVRVRTEVSPDVMRRALVQALLMRIAVAHHGVNQWLTAPLWLEQACVGWWNTRAVAAQLDALKQQPAPAVLPTMETLLYWQRGREESVELATSAIWLLTFFQAESGRGREWSGLLLRLVKGDDPLVAVAMSFPGRFGSAEQRELWWHTGYYAARRTRTLPSLESAESRQEIAALLRFVFAGPSDDADVVKTPAGVAARASEPVVAAEFARRGELLGKLLPMLHPFYRNAGVSLAEAFSAHSLPAAKREKAWATFEQDWRDAGELEAAARHALDRLERAGATLPSR